jgi:hypothetical protein
MVPQRDGVPGRRESSHVSFIARLGAHEQVVTDKKGDSGSGSNNGESDFLAKCEFEGMAIWVDQQSRVADRRTNLPWFVQQIPFSMGLNTQPVYFLSARACYTQVGKWHWHVLNMSSLHKDDRKGACSITDPGDV